jgi:hypothetical protein
MKFLLPKLGLERVEKTLVSKGATTGPHWATRLATAMDASVRVGMGPDLIFWRLLLALVILFELEFSILHPSGKS